MKTMMKKIVCLLILAYFVAAMLTACTSQTCPTYGSNYSDQYSKYKVRS